MSPRLKRDAHSRTTVSRVRCESAAGRRRSRALARPIDGGGARDARVRPLARRLPRRRRVVGERTGITSAVAQHPRAAPLPFLPAMRVLPGASNAHASGARLSAERPQRSGIRPHSFSGTCELRQTDRDFGVPQFPFVRRFWKDESCFFFIV